MEPMLDVSNLSFDYLSASSCLPVIDNISFQAFEGDFISIVGPSGCGKSTLALSMMGYYFPPLHYMSGDIVIDGRNISGMKPDDVRKSILGTEKRVERHSIRMQVIPVQACHIPAQAA